MAAHRIDQLSALVSFVLCVAAPAAAQRAVISVASDGGPASTAVLDLVTGQSRRVSDQAADWAFFTSNGAFLLWRPSGAAQWRATDIDSGREFSLPAGFAPQGVVHPSELAVFGNVDGPRLRIGRLDAAGLHVFDPCGPDRVIGPFDIAPDGRSLIAICGATPQRPTSAVVHLDATTGDVRSTLDLATVHAPLGVATTGSEYLLATWAGGPIELERRRIADDQVVTTASLAVRLPMASRGNMLAANVRHRPLPAIVLCEEARSLPTGYSCRVEALDAASLTVVSTLQTSGPVYPSVTFTADGRQALVSGVTTVRLVDLATGQARASASAPPGGFAVAAWGAEPLAPRLAPPAVAGGGVAVSWTLPGESAAVTGYRLEAGSQPGLADVVTTTVGAVTAFGASGVPPGRYYVRARALNANGASPPSNEVIVTVP